MSNNGRARVPDHDLIDPAGRRHSPCPTCYRRSWVIAHPTHHPQTWCVICTGCLHVLVTTHLPGARP